MIDLLTSFAAGATIATVTIGTWAAFRLNDAQKMLRVERTRTNHFYNKFYEQWDLRVAAEAKLREFHEARARGGLATKAKLRAPIMAKAAEMRADQERKASQAITPEPVAAPKKRRSGRPVHARGCS